MKRPFLQQSLTVSVPNENDMAVTIQVIVLAPATGDSTLATSPEELPELREAGWIRHSVADLMAFVRIIG